MPIAPSSAPRGQPRRRDEIEREGGDEDVDELIGHHDREIAGRDSHHQHGSEEDVTRRAMEMTAFAGKRGDRSGNETQRAGADVKREDGQRRRVKQWTLCRYHMPPPLSPTAVYKFGQHLVPPAPSVSWPGKTGPSKSA